MAFIVGVVATASIGGTAAAAARGTGLARLSPSCGPAAPGTSATAGATEQPVEPAGNAWQDIHSWNLPGKSFPLARLVPWSDDRAAMFALVGARVQVARTKDGGSTWSSFKLIPDDGTVSQGGFDLAAIGHQIDYAYASRNAVIAYRTSPDGGRTWTDVMDMGRWNGYAIVQVARGADGTVAVAWARGTSKGYDWIVRVSRNGGRTFGPEVVAGRYAFGAGCVDPGPGQMALGVAGNAVVILFHKGDRLVSRRSTDHGLTWSDPFTLTTKSNYEDFGFANSGEQVLVVLDNKPSLRARLSNDGGRTWSAASRIGGLRNDGFAVGRSAGDWSIAVARFGVLLYSHSADGATWSPLEDVVSIPQASFTAFPPTTLGGQPVVPYYLDPDLSIARQQ
jgi:photosystem II stability/assembly factor-like uncharacterized protein